MRYGENPHQNAAFFIEKEQPEACISTARQIQGVKGSRTITLRTPMPRWNVSSSSVKEPACVIVKHANPCGVALGKNQAAYERAFSTDPESAFGGIIALNGELDEETTARHN